MGMKGYLELCKLARSMLLDIRNEACRILNGLSGNNSGSDNLPKLLIRGSKGDSFCDLGVRQQNSIHLPIQTHCHYDQCVEAGIDPTESGLTLLSRLVPETSTMVYTVG